MCPTLSRENYFLTVINEISQHHVQKGSIEYELQALLLLVAESVRDKKGLNEATIAKINELFEQYQAVRLKVSIVPKLANLFGSDDSQESSSEQILLHTEFVDSPDLLKRKYMEAIISLLEALERNAQLDLQTCIHCGHWFIPYQRAKVARFCSSNCRNRYHYAQRKKDKQKQQAYL